MKIRGGFISNSSSSSFILYGLSSDVSEEMYNIVEEFLTSSDGTEFSQYDTTIDSERAELVEKFLSYYGLCCLTYDQLGWDGIEIGYILDEGSKEEFNRSLKKAEKYFKIFDKDFGTDFANKVMIYSECMQE